jgi:hypothetical protein
MPTKRARRLLVCLGLALALSLLPSPAAAVGLLDLWSGEGGAIAEETAAPAAQGGLWSAFWGLLQSLGLVEPPPTSTPPPGSGSTDASADDDQGVTLDPNG